MDLKRLIIDLQDVQQKIENSGLTDESEELQNIIDEITIISNRPQAMPKIVEIIDGTIQEKQQAQKKEEQYDTENDYGDIEHNEEWWDLQIGITTLNKLKEKLSNFTQLNKGE